MLGHLEKNLTTDPQKYINILANTFWNCINAKHLSFIMILLRDNNIERMTIKLNIY